MNPMRSGPFLTRLRQDAGGNTLAIIAAAFVPLVGLIGGGVDVSRLYLVKTRLQQACDAGALSGRKAMGGGTWTTTAENRADELFTANFADGAYGTSSLDAEFDEDDGVVSGDASVNVPMTLMRVFGFAESSIEVECTAKMEIPNTDIMFVLDTTGSMDCAPEDATVPFCNFNVPVADKRITALRKAVKCFYETLARRDIDDVDCGGPAPSGGAGTAQIRFGFMPYATNVNVGKLLPNSYLVDSATYQTRRPNVAVPPQKTETTWQTYGSSISKDNCFKYMKNESFSGFSPTATNSGGPQPSPTMVTTFPHDNSVTEGGSNGEWGWSGASDTSGTTKSCRRRRTIVTTYYQEKFQNWDYGPFAINVSGLKAGDSSWNNSFTMPSSSSDPATHSVADATAGNDVPQAVITWDGCIEERQTAETTDFDPIPDNAFDLDIDMIPDADDDNTRWKPALPRLIFTRTQTSGSNFNASSWPQLTSRPNGWNTALVDNSTTDYNNGSAYSCPTQAKKLQTWSTVANATSFKNYVNSLDPAGATYHDIGLLWGARFISPTGIFGDDNALTEHGGAIDRHIIFMTDGYTNANDFDYAAYGLPFFDQRQTVGAPSKTQLDQQVNLRFAALCTAVKNMNITLWVVSFGAGVDDDTKDRLETCATDEDHFFDSEDSDDLLDDFKQIASEIADLRLTS